MKNVLEKTRTPHEIGAQYESPGPKTDVFDQSNMVKMELEVTMGLYGKGAWLIKSMSNI